MSTLNDETRIRYTPSKRVKAYAADYLMGLETEHPYVPTPADVARHPDDLPAGWLDPATTGANDPTGHHPARRMFTTGDQALQLIEQALTVAGFLPHEIGAVGQRTRIGREIEGLLTALWEYRRFGFTVEATIEWHRCGFAPHVARVYADAGFGPRDAQYLAEWSNNLWQRKGYEWAFFSGARERIILMLLDHRISRKRAAEYVAAGVQHDEVPALERRRRAGEDISAALGLLAGLT